MQIHSLGSRRAHPHFLALSPPLLLGCAVSALEWWITVGRVRPLYSKNRSIFASLEFGVPFATSGGGELCFSAGKLNPEVSVTSFSVNRLDEVVKAPLTNTSFTLTLSPSSASFSGTFTPNWSAASKTKPGFKGIILQKGESKGGYGFFISNRVNDLDPESGRVTFGPQ